MRFFHDSFKTYKSFVHVNRCKTFVSLILGCDFDCHSTDGVSGLKPSLCFFSDGIYMMGVIWDLLKIVICTFAYSCR